ncbi:DUF1684 domain-containing protein [Actinokineospora globicatena]|uniref:DUF1684 domain-containing protein n=1 Tax=Actinokineospora globicatena TaxID=103729 RepID=UPI0020A4A560|nr:DUF1684 domain-containing protein [Actinokineospora globicatena]MCP2302869.1 hypothetical protein [Actinokineospora globicatena]GLW78748.1 hypothetical protein Aglo01_32300 [Actinokineospora globicatena]GLW84584.1 hypothetical protein Aglo02_22240 [Actinokineospora globicatena]
MSTDEFAAQWQAWKAERERGLADPVGWLALVSLDWLTEEPTAYPGLPGLWWQDADAAYVDPAGGELAHGGAAITEVTRFELVPSGAGTRVVAGSVEVEVARRGGYLIRVHDPAAEVLAAFRGVPAYEPDPAWVLRGVYEPFDEPRPTTVGAVVAGLTHVYTAPGVIRFTVDGAEHTLTAFNGKKGGFSVLFTDATSGVTTYAANRSLEVPDPDEDGTVVLDFNRAVNLPCAFTAYATCPLPPEGNQLPFPVEAGEKTPYEQEALAH